MSHAALRRMRHLGGAERWESIIRGEEETSESFRVMENRGPKYRRESDGPLRGEKDGSLSAARSYGCAWSLRMSPASQGSRRLMSINTARHSHPPAAPKAAAHRAVQGVEW